MCKWVLGNERCPFFQNVMSIINCAVNYTRVINNVNYAITHHKKLCVGVERTQDIVTICFRNTYPIRNCNTIVRIVIERIKSLWKSYSLNSTENHISPKRINMGDTNLICLSQTKPNGLLP